MGVRCSILRCVLQFVPLIILPVARGHEEGERKYIVMGRGASQYVAVCCSKLQFYFLPVARGYEEGERNYIVIVGGALQYVAACCIMCRN